MVMKVEFRTEDGTILRGRIHAPKGASAGVVMAHGFGGTIGHIDHYAQRFAAEGFAVLVYDHRGFGTSDGNLRHEVDPYRQMADWRDAISFAETRPEFLPDAGFGIWGSSFAGGMALVISANDQRIRCVVAQIPNVSGHRNAPLMFTAAQLSEIRRRIAVDRRDRAAGKPPGTMPMFSDTPGELSAFMLDIPPGTLESALKNERWKNEVTLRSLEHLFEFEPAAWTPYLAAIPVMMIIGENDVCTFTDVQKAVFDTISGKKRLVTFPGGHFDAYYTYFAETSEPAAEWFRRHLVHS
jgi:dienelactone hydrolase